MSKRTPYSESLQSAMIDLKTMDSYKAKFLNDIISSDEITVEELFDTISTKKAQNISDLFFELNKIISKKCIYKN